MLMFFTAPLAGQWEVQRAQHGRLRHLEGAEQSATSSVVFRTKNMKLANVGSCCGRCTGPATHQACGRGCTKHYDANGFCRYKAGPATFCSSGQGVIRALIHGDDFVVLAEDSRIAHAEIVEPAI